MVARLTIVEMEIRDAGSARSCQRVSTLAGPGDSGLGVSHKHLGPTATPGRIVRWRLPWRRVAHGQRQERVGVEPAAAHRTPRRPPCPPAVGVQLMPGLSAAYAGRHSNNGLTFAGIEDSIGRAKEEAGCATGTRFRCPRPAPWVAVVTRGG